MPKRKESMATYQMRLTGSPFRKIVDGDKIIESRLYDKKRQQIAVGDKIEFTCINEPTKKVLTKVRAMYLYKSFEELFSDFSPKYFGDESKNNLLKEVKKFYSEEEEKKYGVIGIRIHKIKIAQIAFAYWAFKDYFSTCVNSRIKNLYLGVSSNKFIFREVFLCIFQ